MIGTLNAAIVHPREVFRAAIKRCSAAIICTHSHPSGNPSPSREEIELTKRLVDSGSIIGIDLLNHVIIGGHQFYSLRKYQSFIKKGKNMLIPKLEPQKVNYAIWKEHTPYENKLELIEGECLWGGEERDNMTMMLIYNMGLKRFIQLLPNESADILRKLLS